MQAQTYWNLLEMRKGEELRLTKIDDDIHKHFLEEFSDLDLTQKLDENEMKSAKGKERWRKFINHYEKTVEDFNFGTLLRTHHKEEYGQDTTMFGMFFGLSSESGSGLYSSANYCCGTSYSYKDAGMKPIFPTGVTPRFHPIRS